MMSIRLIVSKVDSCNSLLAARQAADWVQISVNIFICRNTLYAIERHSSVPLNIRTKSFHFAVYKKLPYWSTRWDASSLETCLKSTLSRQRSQHSTFSLFSQSHTKKVHFGARRPVTYSAGCSLFSKLPPPLGLFSHCGGPTPTLHHRCASYSGCQCQNGFSTIRAFSQRRSTWPADTSSTRRRRGFTATSSFRQLLEPSTRRSTLDDRDFQVAAARSWNYLPSAVRDAATLSFLCLNSIRK